MLFIKIYQQYKKLFFNILKIFGSIQQNQYQITILQVIFLSLIIIITFIVQEKMQQKKIKFDPFKIMQSSSLQNARLKQILKITDDQQLKDILKLLTPTQVALNFSMAEQHPMIELIHKQQEYQASQSSFNEFQISAKNKIVYLNNFAKFNRNIFQQLDSKQNNAFVKWFSSLKQIFKNLLCHLNVQVFKKIHSQILELYNQQDSSQLKIYIKQIRQNPELIQYFQYLSSTLSQTYQKIQLYKLEISQKVPPSLFSKISQTQSYSQLKQLDEKLSANGQTIFRYCIENRQFYEFFTKINTINLRLKEYCSIQSYKKQQKIVEQHYNQNPQDFNINSFKFTPSQKAFYSSYKFSFFQLIYQNLLTLITKQLLNYQKLLKYNMVQIIKKYKPSIKQPHFKTFSQNIHLYNIYKSFFMLYKDIQNSMNKQQFYEMQKQFLIMVIEKVKLFVMVMTIPYYTYGNDVSKVMDMELNDEQEIFMKLDDLYVYKKEKINSQLLKNQQNFKEFIKFFNQYIQKCIKFTNYFCLQPTQKIELLDLKKYQQESYYDSSELHQQRICIFQFQQLDVLYNIEQVCTKQNKITSKFIKFIKKLTKITRKLQKSKRFY